MPNITGLTWGEQAGTAPGCSLPFGSGQPNMLLSHSDTKTRQNHEAESFKALEAAIRRVPANLDGAGGLQSHRFALAEMPAAKPSQACRQMTAGSVSQITSLFPLNQPNSHWSPHVARILSPHLPIPAGKAWHGTARHSW